MKSIVTTLGLASAFATAVLALGASGCTTEAFCFSDCGTQTNTGNGNGGHATNTGGGNGGGCLIGCGGNTSSSSSGSSSSGNIGGGDGGTCGPGVDLTSPKTCGTCTNSCYAIPNSNWDGTSITCTPSANPGTEPGKCSGTCLADYYDRDGDGLCETYCGKTANDDKTCNGVDDNCNGQIDEDVDLCTSTTDCGACGHNCAAPHATSACVHTGTGACDTTNTGCQVTGCVCTGPTDCWHDIDKSAANGCEYPCYPSGPEVCGDGIDNDCNGLIDEADPGVTSGDATKPLGGTCYGSTVGECGKPAHAGTWACVSHQLVCGGANVLKPGDQPELCNGLDDDCDGAIDNNPTDVGNACGGGAFAPCKAGVYQCQNGGKVCFGSIEPQPETCDGVDNDCDGTPDNNLPAAQTGPCNVPTPPPNGATSPCHAGTYQCNGGTIQCVGSAGPTSTSDTCGVDANCDGSLTNQPNVQTDVHNCGACGNDCYAGAVHAVWACVTGQCVFQACQPGYYDNGGPGDAVPNDHKCGYACTFVSAKEQCNNKDDNCDGQIDEAANLVTPTISQVCGVSAGATRPECTLYNASTNPAGVSVACTSGAWACTFHTANVCNGTNGCNNTAEVCDTVDNNCNGLLNETTPNYGQPCASDDGKPYPGDGACRTTGTYICDTGTTTKCGAVKDMSKAGPELCDGIDNDCDGLVDEPFSNKGTGAGATYFVKPAVTKVGASLWIYSFEASRPNATTSAAGSGNGYYCNGATCPGGAPTAPTGVPLDKTPACSVPSKIPWFNVSPIEAEQTCNAMGGALCTTAQWQTACVTNPPSAVTCKWGYGPDTAAACGTAIGGASAGTAYPFPIPVSTTRWCNLGPTFDFDTNKVADQDGLLVTGSSALKACYADWTGLPSASPYNTAANAKIYDLTGNLREITKNATNDYRLMGGAFNTQDESGASCDFDFYAAGASFQLYDLGFRCCFSADPTL